MTDVRKDELVVINGGATLNVPTKTDACGQASLSHRVQPGTTPRSMLGENEMEDLTIKTENLSSILAGLMGSYRRTIVLAIDVANMKALGEKL
jgi:hypothetical protein